MKKSAQWTLQSPGPPASLVPDPDGGGWVVSDGALRRLVPGAAVEATPVRMDGAPREVRHAAAGPDGKLWLVLAGADGADVGAEWTIGAPEATPRALDAAPRKLAWTDADDTLWYTGQDNVLHAAPADALASGTSPLRVGDLVAADARLAVRVVGSDEILVRDDAGATEPGAWRTLKDFAESELVGFAPDGALLLFEPGLGRKGGTFEDGRVLSVAPDGATRTVLTGPLYAARAHGEALLVALAGPGGETRIERRALP